MIVTPWKLAFKDAVAAKKKKTLIDRITKSIVYLCIQRKYVIIILFYLRSKSCKFIYFCDLGNGSNNINENVGLRVFVGLEIDLSGYHRQAKSLSCNTRSLHRWKTSISNMNSQKLIKYKNIRKYRFSLARVRGNYTISLTIRIKRLNKG